MASSALGCGSGLHSTRSFARTSSLLKVLGGENTHADTDRMKPGFRVFCLSLVLSFLVCSLREADALVLQPWAQWAGSTSTQFLVIVPGAADFNNDGRLDVMVYKPSTRKFWIGRNVAGFGFSFCATPGSACIGTNTEAWATLPTSCSGYQFYSGDFGGTSLPDVVVYNPCVGDVRVLINSGGTSGGLTGPMATVDPISGWKMIAGDFTGDSKTDVMVYYPGDGSIFVGTNVTFAFTWNQWGSIDTGTPWQFFPGEFTNEGKVDILGYRPSATLNTRVGRNTGSSFTFSQWDNLPSSGITPVVGNFTGTTTADLGIRTSGIADPPAAGSGDFKVYRNADGAFFHEDQAWGDLDPSNDTWTLLAGNFIATGASTALPELFAYYPADGSFWVAENRGLPVEGYAWPLSVAPGGTLGLYTSGTFQTTGPNINIARVKSSSSGVLEKESSPTADLTVASTYQPMLSAGKPWANGVNWTSNVAFTIPTDWIPGYYTATLKSLSGTESQITFIVKPSSAPSSHHRTAIIANVNTWNAYNDWGGGSRYTGKATLSLLRPNPNAALLIGTAPSSLPFPQHHLAHAEVWLYWALESTLGRGTVDIYSDLDFDSGLVLAGPSSGEYNRLILSTHPEYWTAGMRGKLKAFLDAGGTLLYLGGNGIFETGTYVGSERTTFQVTSGTDATSSDPWVVGTSRVPFLFRTVSGSIAERALLGVATESCDEEAGIGAYVPKTPPNQLTQPAERAIYDAIMTLSPPATIGEEGFFAKASGHEIDKVATVGTSNQVTNQVGYGCYLPFGISEVDSTPPGIIRLAEGNNPDGHGADMIYYTHSGGGFVFSVGSINFGQSAAKETALSNLLKRVLDRPLFLP
jgi:hypothetical protein